METHDKAQSRGNPPGRLESVLPPNFNRAHNQDEPGSPSPQGSGRVFEELGHRIAELQAALARLEDALAGSPKRLRGDGHAEVNGLTGQVSYAPPRAKGPLPSKGLTPRQTDVLDLLATGMSNGEIAQRLRLSLNTVERHVSNVYLKVGARNRVDATNYALTHQALPPDLGGALPIEGIP